MTGKNNVHTYIHRYKQTNAAAINNTEMHVECQ